jgi:hypothetical protein
MGIQLTTSSNTQNSPCRLVLLVKVHAAQPQNCCPMQVPKACSVSASPLPGVFKFNSSPVRSGNIYQDGHLMLQYRLDDVGMAAGIGVNIWKQSLVAMAAMAAI